MRMFIDEDIANSFSFLLYEMRQPDRGLWNGYHTHFTYLIDKQIYTIVYLQMDFINCVLKSNLT